MKPYKSLFSESGGTLEVSSEREAKQLVDISNLEWVKNPIRYEMSLKKAITTCPTGYRLPTIQELYTAFVQRAFPFIRKRSYWSSSEQSSDRGEAVWKLNNYFIMGSIGPANKNSQGTAIYVREI